MLLEGHRGWRNERKLDPEEGFPRGRYVMLHTLSHILIRELALECGYNAASIRERIYAEDDGVDPQAGILLYTTSWQFLNFMCIPLLLIVLYVVYLTNSKEKQIVT